MKLIAKIFAFLFAFLFMLLLFSPKVQAYYTLEEYLKKEKIILSDEKVKDSGFTLHLKDSKLYYNGVYGGEIEDISFTSLFLYNSINVKNGYLNSALANFLPKKIEYLSLKYSIINPLNVTISGHGDIGKIGGYINPFNKLIHIELETDKKQQAKYSSLLRGFKANERGVLVYEFRY